MRRRQGASAKVLLTLSLKVELAAQEQEAESQ
jgi:hypothetical protein